MAGVYTVTFENTSITAAGTDHDFFEIVPAADRAIELMALFIGNVTEVGDAQEEMVRWAVIRFEGGTLTSGNGTAAEENPLVQGSPTAGFTAETVASTVATTTGTTVDLHEDTFNIRTGLQMIWPPDMRPHVRGTSGNTLIIRMLSTLADDASMSGTAYILEKD